MLGLVAAVIATLSPSQPRPAESQSTCTVSRSSGRLATPGSDGSGFTRASAPSACGPAPPPAAPVLDTRTPPIGYAREK